MPVTSYIVVQTVCLSQNGYRGGLEGWGSIDLIENQSFWGSGRPEAAQKPWGAPLSTLVLGMITANSEAKPEVGLLMRNPQPASQPSKIEYLGVEAALETCNPGASPGLIALKMLHCTWVPGQKAVDHGAVKRTRNPLSGPRAPLKDPGPPGAPLRDPESFKRFPGSFQRTQGSFKRTPGSSRGPRAP